MTDFDRFGSYYLLRPVGAGNRFSSYLAAARLPEGDQLRTVHILDRPNVEPDVEDFLRRAQRLRGSSSHPNLVSLLDVGEVDGRAFLATSAVVGRDLRDIWNKCASRSVKFPVEIAAKIVSEASRGLTHANRTAEEVSCTAIPPFAVTVSSSGDIQVDLAVALLLRRAGTDRPNLLSYLTPEEARGEALDSRSSVYSMGILLWELLTGRQLFPPGPSSSEDLVHRREARSVIAPSQRAPRVPKELDAICRPALQPARWRRYRSCAELADKLDRLLAERGTSQRASLSEFVQELFGTELAVEEEDRRTLLHSLPARASA